MCRLWPLLGMFILVIPLGRAPVQGVEASGTVATVDVGKRELVVTQGDKTWTFRLAHDARVMINNRPSRLIDLGPGDRVNVIYERDSKNLLVSEVYAIQI